MLLVALAGVLAAIGVGFFSARIGAAVSRDLRHEFFKRQKVFPVENLTNFPPLLYYPHDQRRTTGADAHYHGDSDPVLRTDHGYRRYCNGGG